MSQAVQYVGMIVYNLAVFAGTFAALYYTEKWYCLVGLFALMNSHICENTEKCPICIANAENMRTEDE